VRRRKHHRPPNLRISRLNELKGLNMLSFGELIALASTVQPEGELAARLQSLLNTPFIQSETVIKDIHPRRPDVEGMGEK
jgi:hypothetical protein